MDKTAEIAFTIGDKPFADDRPLTPAGFVIFMAAAVAARWGGKNADWLKECSSFLWAVTDWHPDCGKPIPQDFDWTPVGVREVAEEFMRNA